MVEYHAQTASINVDKGTDELAQAKDLKIKATKVNQFFLKVYSCVEVHIFAYLAPCLTDKF